MSCTWRPDESTLGDVAKLFGGDGKDEDEQHDAARSADAGRGGDRDDAPGAVTGERAEAT